MKFGAMQGILRRGGSALFRAAADLGFEGVELDVRRGEEDVLFTAEGLEEVRRAARDTGLAVPSVCLGVLNGFGFKDADPEPRRRAAALIRRTLALAGELGARVVLVPFFGHSELADAADRDRAVQGLRDVAADAERAGVVLALENTLSAAENLEILERVGSPSVRVYFDVSNAMWWGHDSPTEIRRLGPAVAQIHFKDGSGGHSNAMLGQGHVDFPEVVRAIADIGYTGWIVLESAAPHDPLADASHNLTFSRALFT